jgi:hypothetical protein
MSAGGTAHDRRSAEERAEELMERVATDASRIFSRVLGRTREELDDIWAEAVSMRDSWRKSEPEPPESPS